MIPLYLAGCVLAGDAAERMPGALLRPAKYMLVAFWPLWASVALVTTVAVLIVLRVERILEWWRFMNKSEVITKVTCRRGWHKWELKKDTGINRYHECRRCGERMVRTDCHAGYQPVNQRWLPGVDCEL